MNAARYKLMLSYLPGMAAIVNSFQSLEVQQAVYASLMEALNVRMDAESPGSGATSSQRSRVSAPKPPVSAVKLAPADPDSGVLDADGDVAHDLEEGDSIHALMEQHA